MAPHLTLVPKGTLITPSQSGEKVTNGNSAKPDKVIEFLEHAVPLNEHQRNAGKLLELILFAKQEKKSNG